MVHLPPKRGATFSQSATASLHHPEACHARHIHCRHQQHAAYKHSCSILKPRSVQPGTVLIPAAVFCERHFADSAVMSALCGVPAWKGLTYWCALAEGQWNRVYSAQKS